MKILRAYAVTAIICLSVTAIAACIFIADENAKKISLGNESAVVVMTASDERIYENAVNYSAFFEKIRNAAKKAAGFAPPPVSNIYWFSVNSKTLLS